MLLYPLPNLKTLSTNSIISYLQSKKLIENIVREKFHYVAVNISRDLREKIEAIYSLLKMAKKLDEYMVHRI